MAITDTAKTVGNNDVDSHGNVEESDAPDAAVSQSGATQERLTIPGIKLGKLDVPVPVMLSPMAVDGVWDGVVSDISCLPTMVLTNRFEGTDVMPS